MASKGRKMQMGFAPKGCLWHAAAKYALHSDADLPVPIFLGTGDPLTTISVQRMF